jgi:hypothetical protein
MAENKKSFLLYCDVMHTVKKLSNEQAGELFKHILSYVNDENPVTNDVVIDLVFEPIKQNLKRDLRRYEDKRLKNTDNANKRWHNKDATVCDGINENANHAVNVNVNVNDNVIDNVKVNKINNSIELLMQKKSDFQNSLVPFVQEFSKDTIRAFFDYWSEAGKNGKMKFEMQKTWETKLRLCTWKRNESGFNRSGPVQSKPAESKQEQNNRVARELILKIGTE